MTTDFIAVPPRERDVKMFHLCLRCENGKPESLNNEQFCERFIDALLMVLNVRAVGRVVLKGVSLAVVFDVGGIQFHSWPGEGVFFLDIISAKDFPYDVVAELVENWFGATARSV